MISLMELQRLETMSDFNEALEELDTQMNKVLAHPNRYRWPHEPRRTYAKST